MPSSRTASLSHDQRNAISFAMSLEDLNKCYDCCLVPDCHECGPCEAHDEATEAEAATAWVNENAGRF